MKIHPYFTHVSITSLIFHTVFLTLVTFSVSCSSSDEVLISFHEELHHNRSPLDPIKDSAYSEIHDSKQQPHPDPIVLIRTKSGHGTGFFIDDHHVITAAHVIKGSFLAELRTEKEDRFYGHIIGYNHADDIALIKAFSFDEAYASLELSESDVQINNEIKLWKPNDYHYGMIVDLNTEIEIARQVQKSLFTINIPVQKGQSGSPVTNLNNEVIGIVSARSLVDDQKTYVVPIHSFIERIDLWRKQPKSPDCVLNPGPHCQ